MKRILISTVNFIAHQYHFYAKAAVEKYDTSDILNLNLINLADQNSDLEFDVFVTDNFNKSTDYREFELDRHIDNVRIFNVRGISNQLTHTFLKTVVHPNKIVDKIGQMKAGLHHAIALDMSIIEGLKCGNHDYLIILDPDCFFLGNISELISHMKINDLSVIGTPYGYSSIVHWKKSSLKQIYDTPTVFFMLIDLNKIDHSDIVMNFLKLNIDGEDIDKEDCSAPMRQVLFHKKYESFNMCIGNNCDICKKAIPNANKFNKYSDVSTLGERSFERFIFNNKICAIHIHIRHFSGSYLQDIQDVIFPGTSSTIKNVIGDHPEWPYFNYQWSKHKI